MQILRADGLRILKQSDRDFDRTNCPKNYSPKSLIAACQTGTNRFLSDSADIHQPAPSAVNKGLGSGLLPDSVIRELFAIKKKTSTS